MEENTSNLPPSVRTGEGIRNLLFDEIDALRSGSGDRRRAMAICALAGQIINSAKLEIEYEYQQSLRGAAERSGVLKENGLVTLRLGNK